MASQKKVEIKSLFKVIVAILFLTVALIVSAPEVYAAGTVKSITVTNAPSNKLTVNKGKTVTLKTKVTVTGKASKALTYSSSDKKTVTVSDKGVVKGVKAGTAKVTVASKQNKKVKVVIKVTVATPVTNIKLSGTTVSVGDKVTIKATVTPTSATNKKLTWSSNNTKIAKVDASTGKVTGVASGTAKITATAKDGSGVKGTCTVKVEEKTYTVSGKVTDANNNVISGATVTIGKKSAKTNSSGKYSITVTKGTYNIVATYKTSDGAKVESKLSNQNITKKTTKDIKISSVFSTQISLKDIGDYGKWSEGNTSYGSGKKLWLKTGKAYTLVATKKDDTFKYTATVSIKKGETTSDVSATVVLQPVNLKGTLALDKKQKITVNDTEQYYQFTPSKDGNYYFYIDGSEDVDFSLYTIGVNEDNEQQFIDNDSGVIEIDSYHTQTYCSVKLQANKVYYLEFVSENKVTVTVGVTAKRPELSNEEIKEEDKAITIVKDSEDSEDTEDSDTWYKFVPQKSAEYYFYVEGDLTEEDVDNVSVTLQTENPNYDINDEIKAQLEDSEDDEDSETVVEAYQELELREIASKSAKCYASPKLTKGTTYYVSVQSEKTVQLGVTATHPTMTDNVITAESDSKSVTLNVEETVYYEFVPEVTATYYFYATANLGFDLYDESMESLSADSIPSRYKNCIYYKCNANTVYYLGLSNIDEESTFVKFGVTATEPFEQITVGVAKNGTCTEEQRLCYRFVPTESGQYYFYVDNADVSLALYENKYEDDVVDVEGYTLESGTQYITYNFEEGKEYYLAISSDKETPVNLGLSKELPN